MEGKDAFMHALSRSTLCAFMLRAALSKHGNEKLLDYSNLRSQHGMQRMWLTCMDLTDIGSLGIT